MQEAVAINKNLYQKIAEKIRGTKFRTTKTLDFETPIKRDDLLLLSFRDIKVLSNF